MGRRRAHPRRHALAAIWCSIFAWDRAQATWTLKLSLEDIRHPVMELAYRAFVVAKSRHPEWSRAEQWAEAASTLESGVLYHGGRRHYWY